MYMYIYIYIDVYIYIYIYGAVCSTAGSSLRTEKARFRWLIYAETDIYVETGVCLLRLAYAC